MSSPLADVVKRRFSMELLLHHFSDYSSVAQMGTCVCGPHVKSLHTWLSVWVFLITSPHVNPCMCLHVSVVPMLNPCTPGCLGGITYHRSPVGYHLSQVSVPNEGSSEGREVEGHLLSCLHPWCLGEHLSDPFSTSSSPGITFN